MVFSIALCEVSAPLAAQNVPARLFPKSGEIPGWTLKSGPVLFPDNRLFDYMDGAAEIPKSYGFRSLGSARYAKDKTILEVAVFDMGSAANAYGYFTARVFLEHSPRSVEKIIPLDHPSHLYANVGVLTLWKGRYTIILQPDDGKPDERTLLAFARYVAARIDVQGAEPPLVSALPRDGKTAGSTRYIRGKAAFDATVMFSARDLLGMAKGPEAAAAEYKINGGEATLAVVKYPSQEAANAASQNFRKWMAAGKSAIGRVPIPGAFACTTPGRAKSVGLAGKGKYLLLVVGAKDIAAVADGLRKLASSVAR